MEQFINEFIVSFFGAICTFYCLELIVGKPYSTIIKRFNNAAFIAVIISIINYIIGVK